MLSHRQHTAVGIGMGTLFVLVPLLVQDWHRSTAAVVSMQMGVFILLSEILPAIKRGGMAAMPIRDHLKIDVLAGVFMLASPWLFGFGRIESLETWAVLAIMGLMMIGHASITRRYGWSAMPRNATRIWEGTADRR